MVFSFVVNDFKKYILFCQIMCEPDFTLCFLKHDTPLLQGWHCIHNFPTVDSTVNYLTKNPDKKYYSRLYVYNKCWPTFVKSLITRKRLLSDVKITEDYYNSVLEKS